MSQAYGLAHRSGAIRAAISPHPRPSLPRQGMMGP